MDNHAAKIVCITTVDLTLRFVVLDFLKYLLHRGYEVIGMSSDGPYVKEVERVGIRVVTVSMGRRITPLQDLRALWQLVAVLRREKPNLVHTHTPKANLLGQLASVLAGVPVRISTVHGLYFTPDTPWLKRSLFRIVETASARLASVVFFVNRADVTTAVELGICEPSRLRVLPGGMGINLNRFDPASIHTDKLRVKRQELGLPDDALTVGYVGRLVREKGLLDLFAAIREVLTEIPSIRLLVIGPYDRDKPDSLSPDSVKMYGIEKHCVFTGHRDDTPEMYALMDIFVLPSYREGLPLAAMEAQAMGLPVVTTEARGCRESIVSGSTGLIVPPGLPHELGNAILTLARNPALRLEMGQAGRKLAEERFDQRCAFECFEEEYLRLLKSNSGARIVRSPTP